MTRGRRKDLTIPPSRALLQQRDYRARKAQYMTELEDRVKRLEEENIKLHKEIDLLRMREAATGTMGPSPEVVNASSELMHQLTAAAACLARFQQLTFNERDAQAHAIAQAQMQTQNLQPPQQQMHQQQQRHDQLPPVRTTLPPIHSALPNSFPSTTPTHDHSQPRQPTPPRQVLHPSRHQQAHEFPHHQLSATTLPPVPVPAARREYSHLHMTPSDTSRQSTAPPPSSSSAASTSTSASTSPTTTRQNSRMRSNSYAVYNEAESAWGYFDSRDLDNDDDEEEDELYEEESPVIHHQRHSPRGSQRSPRSHASMNGQGSHSGHQSHMAQRTSDMRSTTSLSGSEDTPMRLREDSPMGTR